MRAINPSNYCALNDYHKNYYWGVKNYRPPFVIWGVQLKMAEICAILGYYPAYSGRSLHLDCPETSVRNCRYTPDNIPEERTSPANLYVTQFSSSSSYSHPPSSSTHILKQTHILNPCNFSGFHSGVVATNSGRPRHEAVCRRPSALQQCPMQPTCTLSSSEQPDCDWTHAHLVIFNTFLGHIVLPRV